jgi:hypothetical protein
VRVCVCVYTRATSTLGRSSKSSIKILQSIEASAAKGKGQILSEDIAVVLPALCK